MFNCGLQPYRGEDIMWQQCVLDKPEATHKNAPGLFLHQIKQALTRKVAGKGGGHWVETLSFMFQFVKSPSAEHRHR